MMVWDASTDTVVATLDFAAAGLGRPDHVSMSPTGNYIVGSWAAPVGTVAWTRNFSRQVQLSKNTEHSDLALLPNGHDAYVSIDFQSNDGDVFFVDIADSMAAGAAQRVVLFPTYTDGSATSIHFSGQAFDRPGWVLVSTYRPRRNTLRWLDERVFAVELKPNGRMFGIAHPRSDVRGVYWDEPHASVNRDFSALVFNSNWGNVATVDVDAYLVNELRWDDVPSSIECDPTDLTLQRRLQHNSWALLSLPCSPPAGVGVGAIFGDDLPGTLGVDWAVFAFDPTVNSYVPATATTSLVPGQGFWIVQLSGSDKVVDLPAGSTRTERSASAVPCARPQGCVDISLSGQLQGTPWNLIGNPLGDATAFDDLRISTAIGPCSDDNGCTMPEAANPSGANIVGGGLWRFADESSQPAYVNLSDGASLDVWQGYWIVQRLGANNNQPVVHVASN